MTEIHLSGSMSFRDDDEKGMKLVNAKYITQRNPKNRLSCSKL